MENIKPERILFSGQEYLDRYFTDNLTPKNTEVMRFYAHIYRDITGHSLLEFGGGPTIYTLLSAAPAVEKIHFTDYSPRCLKEVEKWCKEQKDAFDWSKFTEQALRFERGETHQPSSDDIETRHGVLRKRIVKVSRCDIWEDDPLLGSSPGPYGIVATNFCLEATTADKKTWYSFNRKLTRLVEPEGYYVVAALWDATQYTHGGKEYPCVNLHPEDLSHMYESLGFTTIHLEAVHAEQGFNYLFACGQKSQ